MTETSSRTTGNFATEPDAWAFFDAAVERSGAFRLLREVPGECIQPRHQTGEKTARIDRLLIPLAKAVDAGWTDGVIGVECKRSDSKLGPLVTQAIDYTRCAFCLKSPPGMIVLPTWIFIFPAEMSGDLESVCVNNRIGTATLQNNRLRFWCSGTNVISFEQDGSLTAKRPPMGRKRGSR